MLWTRVGGARGQWRRLIKGRLTQHFQLQLQATASTDEEHLRFSLGHLIKPDQVLSYFVKVHVKQKNFELSWQVMKSHDMVKSMRYHELGVMWWIWEAAVALGLPGAGRCLIGREKHSSDFQRNTHQKLEESYRVSGIKLFQVSDVA